MIELKLSLTHAPHPCRRSDMGTKAVRCFVMTSPTGYVNAYTGIARRANAQIVFDADRPLGHYSLKLMLMQDLAVEREVLVSYGSTHPIKERKLGKWRGKLNIENR